MVILRDEIDREIEAGHSAAARAMLVQLWHQSAGPGIAGFVSSRFEKIRDALGLTKARVSILRSFTVEPIVPLLRAGGLVGGLDLEIQIGDFNTYTQEVLDPGSKLYRFEPHIVIVAVQTSEAAPDLWESFADLEQEAVEAAVERSIESYRQLVENVRSRSRAAFVIHSLQIPPMPASGILDAQEAGQSAAIGRINEGIRTIARQHKNVYVLDYNNLIARRGFANWNDPRKWLMARLPISANELNQMAREWLRFIHPLTGRVCKALAVDLDNTLWGGVIGEEGMEGIKLDENYPGAAYRQLQRVILDLYRRGIILAVCSKNNPAEAMEAIEKHPGMLLRAEHFAAYRINWNDKAQNLRELAKELNIGIDAIAFLDDNPVEREWIREQLPEVTIVELPDDPMGFADALRQAPVFERLELTEEDKVRGKMYVEQRMRSELQQTASSLEDFYRSLAMSVKIAPVTAQTLARTAQLTQKTNQFNMTTRRYSEEQVKEMLKSPQWRAYTLSAADRFGDNGIVGVALTRCENGVCEIDSFLLSCRVIGRTIETAFLAHIAEDARRVGARTLAGNFVATKKNAPARDFYEAHGFAKVAEGEGQSRWEYSLDKPGLSVPAWISVNAEER